METIKANILKAVSEEHESVYRFASQFLKGFESAANNTTETKIANSIFNAIIRFADSRLDIDRNLSQIIGMAKSEQARLRNGAALDLGWINPTKFEAAVQESKKLWHEIHTLAYLIGLTANEIEQLAYKIHTLTEYNK